MTLEFEGTTFNTGEYRLRKQAKELKQARPELVDLKKKLLAKEEEVKQLKRDLYNEKVRAGRLEAKLKKEVPVAPTTES